MQYKQPVKILTGIINHPDVPSRAAKGAIRELLNADRVLSRFGLYRKRSPQQILWRLASGADRRPAERLNALLKLMPSSTAANEGAC